jgi:hypothetical protein
MEREFDYDVLTPDAQISYDIWKFQYEDAVVSREFQGNQYLFTQFSGSQALALPPSSLTHSTDE